MAHHQTIHCYIETQNNLKKKLKNWKKRLEKSEYLIGVLEETLNACQLVNWRIWINLMADHCHYKKKNIVWLYFNGGPSLKVIRGEFSSLKDRHDDNRQENTRTVTDNPPSILSSHFPSKNNQWWKSVMKFKKFHGNRKLYGGGNPPSIIWCEKHLTLIYLWRFKTLLVEVRHLNHRHTVAEICHEKTH